MLSRKYKFARSVLERASSVYFLHKKFLVLAQLYIDIDKGFRFSYMPDENGEIEFLNCISKKYQSGFVYFDVGAHIGTYTDMIVDRFQDYSGHLFEISQSTFDRLVERHGRDDRLTLNNLGLSDAVGSVEYRAYAEDPTRNGIAGVAADPGFTFDLKTADCVTGDHYCAQNAIERIHLLKIDAEGYDLHVLRGFGDILSRGAIDVVQFEYNYRHGDLHVMLRDFYDYLGDHGYRTGALRQRGVDFKPFESRDNNFENGPNYISCRPSLEEELSDLSGG